VCVCVCDRYKLYAVSFSKDKSHAYSYLMIVIAVVFHWLIMHLWHTIEMKRHFLWSVILHYSY